MYLQSFDEIIEYQWVRAMMRLIVLFRSWYIQQVIRNFRTRPFKVLAS